MKEGTKSICERCNKQITFLGYRWFHSVGNGYVNAWCPKRGLESGDVYHKELQKEDNFNRIYERLK